MDLETADTMLLASTTERVMLSKKSTDLPNTGCVKFRCSLAKPCDERAFRWACSYTIFSLFHVNVKEKVLFCFFNLKKKTFI